MHEEPILKRRVAHNAKSRLCPKESFPDYNEQNTSK
jgi:hypothetical protein